MRSSQSLPPPPLAAVVVVPDAHVGRPSLRRIDEAPLVPGQLRLAFGTGVVALDEVQPQSAVFGKPSWAQISRFANVRFGLRSDRPKLRLAERIAPQ